MALKLPANKCHLGPIGACAAAARRRKGALLALTRFAQINLVQRNARMEGFLHGESF